MKRAAVFWLLGLALLTTALPVSSGAARPIRVGTLGFASDAGIALALKRGYFRAQGIEVSIERFFTGAEQMALLGSGGLEIASGAPAPAFFNAIARGLPIAAVADKGSARKGFSSNALVVRKALVDSGRYRGLNDLKGLVLASPDSTNIAQFCYYRALKSAGLTMQDVRFEYMSMPDSSVALASGKVDVIQVSEPLASATEARGIGKIVLNLDELLPGFQTALIFYNRDWARRNPEGARGWMVAYVRALRDYNRALQTGNGRDDLIATMGEYTSIKDRAVWDRMVWPGLDPDGSVAIRGLLDYERWLVTEHLVSQFVLPDSLADPSYTTHAIAVLGPYRR